MITKEILKQGGPQKEGTPGDNGRKNHTRVLNKSQDRKDRADNITLSRPRHKGAI